MAREGDKAISGDWNGDGIHTVGIYRNRPLVPRRRRPTARWSRHDVSFDFGEPGDLPVIGDWTGDGISKMGVFRNGTFHLDTNNNHQLDAADKTVQFGESGDLPVAGDWDGDGNRHRRRLPQRPDARCSVAGVEIRSAITSATRPSRSIRSLEYEADQR